MNTSTSTANCPAANAPPPPACSHTEDLLDSLGRVIQTQLVSDPDPAGPDKTDTTYDSLGRVKTVSNPYRGSAAGGTSYVYDALGRITQVTYADSSVATASYSGNCATPPIRRARSARRARTRWVKSPR